MSDNQDSKDIGSIFMTKKTKGQAQKKQQTQQKKTEQKEKEKQETVPKAAPAHPEDEFEDEGEDQGKLDIGAGQVLDIKQVKQKEEEEQDAQNREKGLNLENIYKGKNDFDEQKKPKEDPKDQKKGDGIKFQGKPQFKKNQGIGNKALFPGLPGEEEEKDQKKTPADIGGPIGPTTKEEEKEPEQKTGPPKFKGGAALKNLLKSQNEENKEANVGIEQYKQKLQSDIKIHEKPQKREDFKEKSEQENQEKKERYKEQLNDMEDGFDQRVEEKKRDHRQQNREGERKVGEHRNKEYNGAQHRPEKGHERKPKEHKVEKKVEEEPKKQEPTPWHKGANMENESADWGAFTF